MPKRAALYVDGFNLYHAVDDLKLNYLKWSNLWRLGEIIIPSQSQILVKVAFCTAFYPGSERKKFRHLAYNDALRASGVEVVLGHYVTEPKECTACGDKWRQPNEKETDINVALSVFDDGYKDVFDHAYVLSADSDQAATFRMFRGAFPNKEITTVAPPARNFSTHVLKYNPGKIALTREHMERVVMPKVITGAKAVIRPHEYAPPADWVHPDDRPQKAKP